MKEYFVSKLWLLAMLIAQLLPLFFLGVMAYASIATGVGYKAIAGFLILALIAAMLWWLTLPAYTPAVRISDSRIEVRGFFGLRTVEDVNTYTLVLASTWIGFRRKGRNDIIVDKGPFSKSTWESLRTHVQQLPFAHLA